VLAHLCYPHVLSREHVAEIYLPSVDADPSAARHRDRVIVEGVGELLKAAIDARRSHVQVGRYLHGERLVGTLPVVTRHEFVEARLLLEHVGRGRLGRFCFQR
jgi:hypothetical protein